MSRWNRILQNWFAASSPSVRKAPKHSVRLTLELLEGRLLLSGDIDGSGTITGSLSGKYGPP